MAEKLEVFVVEPCEVDWFAFSLWLEGCSEEEATEKRSNKEPEYIKDFPDYDTLLRSETRNYYRVFRALEVYLHSPPSLFAQVREGWRGWLSAPAVVVGGGGGGALLRTYKK